MNPNAIALAATVTAAAAADLFFRLKPSAKKTSANQPTPIADRQVNKILMEQVVHLAKINEALAHQNEYMSGLIDEHNVPITEFDRIAMSYPKTAEK